MVQWLNRAIYQAPRNGTTSHTINPSSSTNLVSGAAFTPTAGRLLVVVVEGSVTSSTPSGWTLPTGGSAINNTGLYVWYKTATGSDAFTTTHNGANYDVLFAVYEFPAGSSFVGSVSAQGVGKTSPNPQLNGLTGTNSVFAVKAYGANGGLVTAIWTWTGTGSPTQDWEYIVPFNPTDGYAASLAYVDGYTGSSWQPTGSTSTAGTAADAEALTFAVKVPSSSNNDGTFSISLPKVTTSISGQSINSGTMSASVPRVTTSINGSSKNNGTLSAAIPKVTSSIAGNSVNPGTFAATLPVITANIGESAAAIPGTFNSTLPRVTVSISGAMENDGSLTASTRPITASLTGQSVNPGSFNATLPKVTAAIADTSVNPGTFAAALPKVTSSIAGTSRLSGSIVSSTPKLTFTGSGASKVIGSLSCSVPKVTFAGSGTGPASSKFYIGDTEVQIRLGDLPVILKKG